MPPMSYKLTSPGGATEFLSVFKRFGSASPFAARRFLVISSAGGGLGGLEPLRFARRLRFMMSRFGTFAAVSLSRSASESSAESSGTPRKSRQRSKDCCNTFFGFLFMLELERRIAA